VKIKEIYEILDSISPFELQEDWDNSGLLIGDFENEISKIYLTLDIDEELLEKVDKNSLIIAHHPLIFKPLKNLIPSSFSTKLAIKMIQKNISFIAMHTNFDKTHLNKYVAEKVLGLKGESKDFIYSAEINESFDEFAKKSKIQTQSTKPKNRKMPRKHKFSKYNYRGWNISASLCKDRFIFNRGYKIPRSYGSKDKRD
jgi:putative NIF3 family GTP cyclohydrolase 1 type 2